MALAVATHVIASPITGSIAFNGTPNFDILPIADATAILSYDSGRVAVGQQTGIYTAVADLTPVIFSPFVFSPATQAINPLWSFTSGLNTYSFATTSVTAMFNPTLNIWNYGGKGILSATGYDNTSAEWNFSAGQIGQSFYFGSAAAAVGNSVPDGGMTLMMLGLGLVGLVGLKRFFPQTA